MRAMILAAGVGSRLDPLTTLVPKPLVPIANVPVMEHILALVHRHGFRNVCANLHYMPDKLTEYFKDGSDFGVDLHFRNEKELSGDAGGVRALKNYLQDGTFIVLMGDLVTDCDLTHVIAQHKKNGAIASIGIKPVEAVERFGVVVTDDNGRIVGFQEKPARSEALSNMVSTGIYILEPEVFDYIPKEGSYGFGRQLFPSLVEKKLPVYGVEINCYWSDVGTIEQYRHSNFDVLDGAVKLDLHGEHVERDGAQLFLSPGVDIADDVKIEGRAIIGRNCKIGRGARLSGRTVIGDNCVIEPFAQVTDSVVWSDVIIAREAVITDTVVSSSDTQVTLSSKPAEVASSTRMSPGSHR